LPPLPIADSFLAGSILSLLMPVLLLIGLVTWYLVAIKHVGGRRSKQAEPAAVAADGESDAPAAPVAGAQASATGGPTSGAGATGG
jgi:hypothetical protein